MAAATNALKVQFMKGAGEQYDNFHQQASDCLYSYCSQWNNYNNPRSYIIPPAFEFKHPEVSESALEEFKTAFANRKTIAPIISDRKSDQADYLVYQAIENLKKEPALGAFLAIRGLNLDLNLNIGMQLCGRLTRMFPFLDWNRFHQLLRGNEEPVTRNSRSSAEYDYILIGPKLGLVVIETKSSTFDKQITSAGHSKPIFSEGYQKGIDQLKSFDAVLYLLNSLQK